MFINISFLLLQVYSISNSLMNTRQCTRSVYAYDWSSILLNHCSLLMCLHFCGFLTSIEREVKWANGCETLKGSRFICRCFFFCSYYCSRYYSYCCSRYCSYYCSHYYSYCCSRYCSYCCDLYYCCCC